MAEARSGCDSCLMQYSDLKLSDLAPAQCLQLETIQLILGGTVSLIHYLLP